MSEWRPDKGTPTSPRPGRLRDRDLPPLPTYEPPSRDRPRRRERQWPHVLIALFAMYGAFSLVIHAVVIYEVTR